MPRKPSLAFLKFLIDLFLGFIVSFQKIKDIAPGAVFGMGGYISFSAVVSAKLQGIKAIIHEQNFLPGLITGPFQCLRTGWP